MFSKPATTMAPPATACEDGGCCSRMDFVLEAQHIPPGSFRLISKDAKYVQRFAERDTSSRIVLRNSSSNEEEGNCACDDLPLLMELAWWFSETLKGEKPERRVVRYFFGSAPSNIADDNKSDKNGQSDADKEALDFLYSLICQLVRAFPNGQTSAQGVVVSALPPPLAATQSTMTADEFRAKVDQLDGTMATPSAGAAREQRVQGAQRVGFDQGKGGRCGRAVDRVHVPEGHGPGRKGVRARAQFVRLAAPVLAYC
ncbi:hypothetical protein PG994_013654 [Apiospora phragmitis]|uniref:Uncharacterized protein n=1 Tax=Apiospora phragmitis TaxID=2905665 RepID=A0ABR1T993_9PEZI